MMMHRRWAVVQTVAHSIRQPRRRHVVMAIAMLAGAVACGDSSESSSPDRHSPAETPRQSEREAVHECCTLYQTIPPGYADDPLGMVFWLGQRVRNGEIREAYESFAALPKKDGAAALRRLASNHEIKECPTADRWERQAKDEGSE